MVAFGDDGKYDGFGTRLTTTVNTITPNVSALANATVLLKRYSIPGPNGELTTETSITNSGKPAFDYIWIGGKPIAEIDANRTYFDFTDHLNAPIIQTNSSGAVSYWADYEPYGKIYDLRPGSAIFNSRYACRVKLRSSSKPARTVRPIFRTTTCVGTGRNGVRFRRLIPYRQSR